VSRAAERPDTATRLALPDAGHGPGVLVIACGAREGELVEEACTRLARHGFVALGIVATDAAGLDAERRRVDDALDALFRDDATDGARAGIVGFGRGGALAVDAASRGAAAAALVGFGGVAEIAALEDPAPDALAAPLLVAVGEKDPDATPAALDALRARLGGAAKLELRVLPGAPREFFDPVCADRYDALAARAAWDAALARLLAEL